MLYVNVKRVDLRVLIVRKKNLFSVSLILYLYEKIDVHYCDHHSMMDVSEIITLYTLDLYSAVGQFYLNKTGKNMCFAKE